MREEAGKKGGRPRRQNYLDLVEGPPKFVWVYEFLSPTLPRGINYCLKLNQLGFSQQLNIKLIRRLSTASGVLMSNRFEAFNDVNDRAFTFNERRQPKKRLSNLHSRTRQSANCHRSHWIDNSQLNCWNVRPKKQKTEFWSISGGWVGGELHINSDETIR